MQSDKSTLRDVALRHSDQLSITLDLTLNVSTGRHRQPVWQSNRASSATLRCATLTN